MFGKVFSSVSSVGYHMGRSLLRQTALSYSYSQMFCNLQTQCNYLRSMPVTNAIQIQNLRELLMSKREVGDTELTELTSINQIISLIMRGTLTAKRTSNSHPHP